MFSNSSPSTTAVETSPASPAPAAPTTASSARSGRLRGLSYLRSYTQDRLHLGSREGEDRSSHKTSVATTHPTSTSSASPQPSPSRLDPRTPEAASAAVQHHPGAADGWIPVQGACPRWSTAPTAAQITSPAPPTPSLRMADTPSYPLHVDQTIAGLPSPHQEISRSVSASPNPQNNASLPTIQFIPYNELSGRNRPSLDFSRIIRTLPTPSSVIKVGRYSERDSLVESMPHRPSDAPVGFKSKVVSRRHCEFWNEHSQWYVKDVGSSSGTFLNHVRLSPPGMVSKPWAVKDGDIVQLGIDFKGGEEMIFRCVKIRIECNRGHQKKANKFNKLTHQQLRQLAGGHDDNTPRSSTECTICLNSIAPCQALFVAPCSHTWHFKCVRKLLEAHPVHEFTCPNCRAQHFLNADVEDPESGLDSEAELIDPLEHLSLGDEHDETALEPPPTDDEDLAEPIHNGRARTPSATHAAALVPDVISGEGPLTPRNNAGPFVFDGTMDDPAARRSSRAEMTGLEAALLDHRHGVGRQ